MLRDHEERPARCGASRCEVGCDSAGIGANVLESQMRLTSEQRTALDALTPKRRAFVLAYVGEEAGNGTGAARSAGYAKPGEEAHRLLKNAQVMLALEAFRAPAEDAAIATAEELRAFWSGVMRGGDEVTMRDRLKASELLGKSQGAFVERRVERREVSGPAGGPLVFGTIADAEAWAAGGGE